MVDVYLLVATVTLAIQFFVLVLLVAGYGFKRQKKYRRHGVLMFTAVVLHLITVLIIMVPSFGVIVFTDTGLSATITVYTIIHGVLGLTTLVLGSWITLSWRFRQSLQYCSPKKLVMRATLILWVITIAAGIVMYFSLYNPFMA